MSLIVTFSKSVGASRPVHVPPIPVGASARTELITLATTDATAGTLTAAAGEDVLEVHAEEACWIEIGPSPAASVGGDDCRFLPAGAVRQYWVDTGDKVSGIEA
jgi:hypothetical protein